MNPKHFNKDIGFADISYIPANYTPKVVGGQSESVADLTSHFKGIDDELGYIVNVKKFGAVGDGVTDDTTAIQSAINQTSSNVVFFPKGIYLVSSSVTLRNNISLVGEYASIIKTNNQIQTFYALSKTNIKIHKLSFYGPNLINLVQDYGIYLDTCSHIKITDCEFQLFHKGISSVNSSFLQVQNNYFHDILRQSDGSHGYGFHEGGGNNLDISFNKFERVERHCIYVGVGCTNVSIIGNNCYNNGGMAIALNCYDYQSLASNIVISNNLIDTISSYHNLGSDNYAGIGATGKFTNIVISDNTIKNVSSSLDSAYGILIQNSPTDTNPIDSVLISNNILQTIDDIGIIVNNGKNVTILGNIIKNAITGIALLISGTSGGGAVASDITIAGNIISYMSNYGISIAGRGIDYKCYSVIDYNIINNCTTSIYNFGDFIEVINAQRLPKVIGTAGVALGTQTGKVKLTNSIKYMINNKVYSKSATDNLWNLTSISTGSSEYRKVSLCLDSSGTAKILVGAPSITQASASVLDVPNNYVLVGIIEINNSYSGGSLSGFTIYDI